MKSVYGSAAWKQAWGVVKRLWKPDEVPIDMEAELTALREKVPAPVFWLFGKTQSGKTSLIRTILGLQKPDSGDITVLGLPAGSRPLRATVGYVTQAPSVYSDLTVHENISYFAALLGAGKADVEAVLKYVELDEYRGRLVDPRYRFRTATIIEVLGITETEMRACNLRHLVSPELRREMDRQRWHQRRAAAGSVSRAEYLEHSLTRQQPWEAEGISRRTWYRRHGTSPSRCMVASPSFSDLPPDLDLLARQSP